MLTAANWLAAVLAMLVLATMDMGAAHAEGAVGCAKKNEFMSVQNGSINTSFGINKQAATFIATCDVRDNEKNVTELRIVEDG